MKKRELFLLFFFMILIFKIVYSQSGNVGTGLAVIATKAPTINLIEPLNNSGDADGNITFFFNVSDASDLHNCSLIINNKINITNGTTIKKDTKLNFTLNNTAIGPYNWSVNCTDSLGFNGSSDNRTFTVIFMKKFNGTTTNISLINVMNITNFVVEITSFGKINFSQDIDLSQGFDLDKFINITSNKIELDSFSLNQLNKSATLYLYDLTFTNPRVVKDGVACPSAICTEVSYSDGIFVFNVSHFTSYSAEETPSTTTTTTTTTGGGGGGGGGTVQAAKVSDFETDKNTLKVVLRQGETKEESFSIKNTGEITLDVTAYLDALRGLVISPSLNEIKATLNPGEEQTINIVFGAAEDLKPDAYTGEIKLRSGDLEKTVNAIIEVESAKPLFDVDIEVLPEYKSIFPGNDVLVEVSLFNVRGFGRVDVNLEYSIKDFLGNVIATEHETVAVETQAKFVRELLVPADTIPGSYVALAKVAFEDSVGISSDVFEVKAKALRLYPIAIKDFTIQLLIGILAVIAVSIFLVYRYMPRRKPAPKTREEETKVIKAEGKVQKLEKELEAMEKAYKSGLISKGSYLKSRERIGKEISKLKRQ